MLPEGQPTCKNLRLLILWHTGSGEDLSFHQQKRSIILLIKNLANGTEIYLATVDAYSHNLTHFRKDSTDTSWKNKINTYKPGNHILPKLSISYVVYSLLNQVRYNKIAEEVILVVNNKTVFDDIENVKEILKYKLTFIIFVGKTQPTEELLNLATDKDHLVSLSDSNDGDIIPVVHSVLDLCCKDSRLICDTDEYWTGKRCYKCFHICSIHTENLSAECLQKCPYFAKHSSSGAYTSHKEGYGKCVHRKDVFLTTFVQVSIVIVCIILIKVLYYLWNKLCEWKKKKNEENENISDDMNLQQTSRRQRTENQAFDISGTNNEDEPLLLLDASGSSANYDELTDIELRVFRQ